MSRPFSARILLLLAGLLFSSLACNFITGGLDNTGQVELELVNETGVDIWYLYVSLSSNDVWGDDRLGTQILAAGERYTVSLPPGTYDLRAEGPEALLLEEVYALEINRDMTWSIIGTTRALSLAPAGRR